MTKATATRQAFQDFSDFYPYYLGEHQNVTCRRLHVVGTLLGAAVVLTALVVGRPALGLLGPVVGYGFSWVGHFFFERNKPATFSHPWWSFRGDMKLLWETLSGQRPF